LPVFPVPGEPYQEKIAKDRLMRRYFMPVDMELEKVLRPHQYDMPPYPPKVITLANGKKMVVRQAAREDVPVILKSVHP
jgi:hypothetical protein